MVAGAGQLPAAPPPPPVFRCRCPGVTQQRRRPRAGAGGARLPARWRRCRPRPPGAPVSRAGRGRCRSACAGGASPPSDWSAGGPLCPPPRHAANRSGALAALPPALAAAALPLFSLEQRMAMRGQGRGGVSRGWRAPPAVRRSPACVGRAELAGWSVPVRSALTVHAGRWLCRS